MLVSSSYTYTRITIRVAMGRLVRRHHYAHIGCPLAISVYGRTFCPVTPKSVLPKSGPRGPQKNGPPDQFWQPKLVPPSVPKTVPPLIMMHGPNLAPRTDFGSQNWSPLAKNVNSPPTDHDARTEFGKHDLLANNYTL